MLENDSNSSEISQENGTIPKKTWTSPALIKPSIDLTQGKAASAAEISAGLGTAS